VYYVDVYACAQVSAKDDVNLSGIFHELLTQARLQLDAMATTTAADDDDDDGQSPGPSNGHPVPYRARPVLHGTTNGQPASELRRRRVGSDVSQRMRAKRTSCHVS